MTDILSFIEQFEILKELCWPTFDVYIDKYISYKL